MVHAQLMARGISDERVLKAMREVPREPFIPERCRDQAYSDQPLSIGWGQTVDGNPILSTARQLKVDQLPRNPGSIRAGEEAGVEGGGLG
jgi:protein-L-isoaspartate(D-aspartate) O-methyltransferase